MLFHSTCIFQLFFSYVLKFQPDIVQMSTLSNGKGSLHVWDIKEKERKSDGWASHLSASHLLKVSIVAQ